MSSTSSGASPWCDANRDTACWLVTKHSWKGRYRRVFSVGTLAITTYNPTTLEITNQWTYDDVLGVKPAAVDAIPSSSAGTPGRDEFVLTVRKSGRRDTLRFSSEHCLDLLTECLIQCIKQCETKPSEKSFVCQKASWSGRLVPCALRVSAAGIRQFDANGVELALYAYKNIRQLLRMADGSGVIFELGEHRRRHLFLLPAPGELIAEAQKSAAYHLGVQLLIAAQSLPSVDAFRLTRLGLCAAGDALTSWVEFPGVKQSVRHADGGQTRRLLCVTEQCFVEREPVSYSPICATPLTQLVCLTRIERDPQQLVVQWTDDKTRTYLVPDRDLLIASILDAARGVGNDGLYVCSYRFNRALRLGPHAAKLDEDAEAQLLKHIIQPPPHLRRSDAIRRLNANVAYTGLLHAATGGSSGSGGAGNPTGDSSGGGLFGSTKGHGGSLITACIEAVLSEQYSGTKEDKFRLEAQLLCLHRLFASRSGFYAFTQATGVRERLGTLVVGAMNLADEAVEHAVVEALVSLMRPAQPNCELRVEQANKHSLLSSTKFVDHLLDVLVKHVERRTGWLVVASLLDLLTYAVCAPFSETTDGQTFDVLIRLVAARGRALCRLFHAPALTIVKSAGLVMRALVEEASDEKTSRDMQALALTDGAFLAHLRMALLVPGRELRVCANRQLSGQLVALWSVDNEPARELLSRCLPRGLLAYLDSTEPCPVAETDLLAPRNNLDLAVAETQQTPLQATLQQVNVAIEAKLDRLLRNFNLEHRTAASFIRQAMDGGQSNNAKANAASRPVVLRRRRQRVKGSSINWRLFAYHFWRDHQQADLVWNEKTREEFRAAVEAELRAFSSERDGLLPASTPVAWNHAEFEVRYASLADELKVGDYYVRFLLHDNAAALATAVIHNPLELFHSLYHRFLLADRVEVRCRCLSAMATVYERHADVMGALADAAHLVPMLKAARAPLERDHLMVLIHRLAANKQNARELLAAGLLQPAVDLALLAHLHKAGGGGPGTAPMQTNVIDYESDRAQGSAAEWHYSDADGAKKGPVSFNEMCDFFAAGTITERTLVWASGSVAGWQPLADVAQFRWTVCIPTGSPAALFDFAQLARLILDLLIRVLEFFPSRDAADNVVRPVPAVKRALSEPTMLYQLVALLLTYDPAIVSRVATLVLLVEQDNPQLGRLFLSGIFFFLLMYNGSNVLPVARLLHYTHAKQAFRSALPRSESTARSVLSPLLPDAAIFYLDYHGAERYAEVFLGEFDNPEVIWSAEMRRHMIGEIARHVADFSTRLSSNVRALYQYCPIPVIGYEALDSELFVSCYYLRSLCDRTRFGAWPIREPVAFLRACLAAWHAELDRRPPPMSVQAAAELLELEWPEEGGKLKAADVRRAYFRLAAKFHPDKNPEGRETFEKIVAAYELLSSSSSVTTAAQQANLTTTPGGQLVDMRRIVLCLRAQSIVYERHTEELAPYKYAGYTQLIRTIALEANDEKLFDETSATSGELLEAAVELAHHTLRASALNAEQLRRENGLEALRSALTRCVSVLTVGSREDELAARVSLIAVRCLTTAAEFEGCRQRCAELPSLFLDVCRLLALAELLPTLGAAAARCAEALGVCTLLQTQLFQAGALWHLVPHLFRFDATLDEGGVAHTAESNKQSAHNELARAALAALSALAGFRADRPPNDGVQNALRAMLTPYVCKSIANMPHDFVLKTLNENLETPYMVWNAGTRAELLDFVEKNATGRGESDLFGAEFRHSAHADQLIVGDVFVRIYCAQPTFVLQEPKKVCIEWLDFIERRAPAFLGQASPQRFANLQQEKEDTVAVMEALCHLFAANNDLEMLLIGQLDTLFALLDVADEPKPATNGNSADKKKATATKRTTTSFRTALLRVLDRAVANRHCLDDVAAHAAQIVPRLMLRLALVQDEDELLALLRLTLAFGASSPLVAALLQHGALVHVLWTFTAPGASPATRELTIDVLRKTLADPANGPFWSRYLCAFLPSVVVAKLRDGTSVTTLLALYDSTAENPELIWNDDARARVRAKLEEHREKLEAAHRSQPPQKWDTSEVVLPGESNGTGGIGQDPNESAVGTGQLVVGGIYIRQFLAQPAWNVSSPRAFAAALLERTLASVAAEGGHKATTQNGSSSSASGRDEDSDEELVYKALSALLANHPHAADQLPAQGYLPRFVAALGSADDAGSRALILVLHPMAQNTMCADALARIDGTMAAICRALTAQPSLVWETSQSLAAVMRRNTGELSAQLIANNGRLLTSVLDVLGSPMPGVGERASAARAELVDALKTAALCPRHGPQIEHYLKQSTMWTQQFAHQKHDLFLATSTAPLALQNGGGQFGGFLTAAPPPLVSNQPPPLVLPQQQPEEK